ncbi:MAG: PA2779 family protein, partial [Gammaproteobacteria bacterium]
PQSAKQRVARLTTEEAELLHNRIQDMPAGAGPLEILVFVFLVLLITDILGFTDIFPFVKKPAR